jgi:hypothetical protein
VSIPQKTIWIILCLFVTTLSHGQQTDETSQPEYISKTEMNEFTRVHGGEDRTIPLPLTVNAKGQKDASALQGLIEYLNAVNLTQWSGMQAKATYIDANGTSSPAALTIGKWNQGRINIETASGTRSTRIDGDIGGTVETNGRRFSLPMATAELGLVVFPRLFSSEFGVSAAAIVDRGQIEIDGELLHRITIEESVLTNGMLIDNQSSNVTDLYFEPVKHLLRMSTSLVQLDSADRERYLVVNRYCDYQTTGTMLMPHTIRQTLNGQFQWTLQLAEIDLQPQIDSSYFRF